MKIPHSLASLLLSMLMSVAAWAQVSRPVEVNYETKVIYTDSLTLPHNINVGALLRLLPELLQRPGDYTLSNYDVQVDGVSVGEAADAVLSVLQLDDIERCVVSNSPTSSDLNSGMSGSINLCLRSIKSRPRGMSGKVAVGLTTERSTMADALFDYRGPKLTVRGMAFGESYAASGSTTMTQPIQLNLSTDEAYRNQLARAMLTFRPNTRHELKLTLTEGLSYDRYTYDDAPDAAQLPPLGSVSTFTQRERKGQLTTRLSYGYALGKSHRLRVSAQHAYKPKHEWVTDPLDAVLSDKQSGKSEVKASVDLSGGTSWPTPACAVTYKVAAKTSYSASNTQVMPLAELTLRYGAVRTKAAVEYQFNKQGRSDWTGRMVMECRLSTANRVRLLLNRQLSRPSMISHEVGIDYIANHVWHRHLLTLNTGVNYCLSDHGPQDSHYVNANLMALYQYDCFFVSFTANLYHQQQEAARGAYHTYCNLSVMPSLNLRNGWRTALNLRYYGKVYERDAALGRCMSLQMNVGKAWGDWSVYAYGRTPLTGRTRNENRHTGIVTHVELIPASVGCGASYRF